MEGAANGDEVVLTPQKREKTGGRQKGTPNKQARFELGASARIYGLRALAVIVEIMEDDEEAASTRLLAAKEVLDRGFGKAKQVTEITGADGDEIQSRLIIEFVGQIPQKETTVTKQITNQGEIIDQVAEAVRVPVFKNPWEK